MNVCFCVKKLTSGEGVIVRTQEGSSSSNVRYQRVPESDDEDRSRGERRPAKRQRLGDTQDQSEQVSSSVCSVQQMLMAEASLSSSSGEGDQLRSESPELRSSPRLSIPEVSGVSSCSCNHVTDMFCTETSCLLSATNSSQEDSYWQEFPPVSVTSTPMSSTTSASNNNHSSSLADTHTCRPQSPVRDNTTSH